MVNAATYTKVSFKILLTSSTYQTMLGQLPSVSKGSTFLPFFCKAEFKVFCSNLFFFHSSIQSNEIKNSESVVDKLASIPAKSHFVNLAYYGSYVFVKLLSDVILETFFRENNLIKVCHHVDFYILEYYIFPIFKNVFFLFQWNSYFSYGEFDYVLWWGKHLLNSTKAALYQWQFITNFSYQSS